MTSLGAIRRADFMGYKIVPASAVEGSTGRVEPVEPIGLIERTDKDSRSDLYLGRGEEEGGVDTLA